MNKKTKAMAYYETDIDEEKKWTFMSFIYEMGQSILTWIPPLPLYLPRTLPYLSEVKLPDGKCIYISDAPSASDPQLLEQHNITGMITIRTSYAILSPIYKRIDQFDNLEKLYIHMDDLPSSNLWEYFEIITKFFNCCLEENRNVLIHCTAGRSRSVSFLIAYIMIMYKMSFDDAFHLVKEHRPEVRINSGFIHQLQTLDRLLQRIKCIHSENIPLIE